MHFANVTCGLKLTSKVLVPSLQNGVHGEVRGHHSALQRQVHQDSTGSAWCVPASVFFSIRRSWSCRRWCPNLCVAVLTAASSLPCVTPPVPTEPLLCKFADGGQKKRQNQGKYLQNGRPWARDGDTVSESFSKKKTPNMNFLPRILAGDQNRKHVSKAAQFFPPLLRLGWLCFVFFFLLSYKLPLAFAWSHRFWILFIVFPGRNDACVWPDSLTKWVSGMHRLAENNPTAQGEKCSCRRRAEVMCCPLVVVTETQTCKRSRVAFFFSDLYLLSQTLVVEWLHINRGGKSIHSLYLNKSTDFSNWKVMIQHLHSCKSKKVTLSWFFFILFFLDSLCFFNCSTTKP